MSLPRRDRDVDPHVLLAEDPESETKVAVELVRPGTTVDDDMHEIVRIAQIDPRLDAIVLKVGYLLGVGCLALVSENPVRQVVQV
jgi:hypothetical protein